MQPFEVEREGANTQVQRPKPVSRGYTLGVLFVALGLGIAATVALLHSFSDTLADPSTTVHRAREILVAEMKGQRPVLESTFIFSKTMIEASQQIFRSLTDPDPDGHVLLVVGQAAKHELATYSEVELLHVRRSCDKDAVYSDLINTFKSKMLQAKVQLTVHGSLHYLTPRMTKTCTPSDIVKAGIFSFRQGRGRHLLSAGWFAGSMALFHEVSGNLTETLNLRVMDAAKDPQWMGAQPGLARKRNWKIFEVMISELHQYGYMIAYKRKLHSFNHLVPTEVWDVDAMVYWPLSRAAVLQSLLLLGHSKCPRDTDLSDHHLPLRKPLVQLMVECFREEKTWTPGYSDEVWSALNIAQRTRILAQASTATAKNQVCQRCQVPKVYKVSRTEYEELSTAFYVAECTFRSMFLAHFPPDDCGGLFISDGPDLQVLPFQTSASSAYSF